MTESSKFVRVMVTVLCVFLALFMTAEVAHVHADGTPDAIHCQFCSTAHVAVTSQPSWLTGYVLHLIGIVSIGEPSPGSRVVIRTAFIRPPPSIDSSLA